MSKEVKNKASHKEKMRVYSAFKLFLGKIMLPFALLLCINFNSIAQDPQFSQFYANPLYTNPAFAGSSTVGRVVSNVRNQWPSIAGTFRSGSFSFDEHYDAINGGFGAMATYDEQGVGKLRTITANAIYAYQIPVTKNITIQAAIQAGFTQKTIDMSSLNWFDQFEVQNGIVRNSKDAFANASPSVAYPNFSAGMIVYSKYFYAGLAAHNLTEPRQALLGTANDSRWVMTQERRYTGHAGMVIPIIESRNINHTSNLYPNIIYMQQGFASQLNLGCYISRGQLIGGLYYRQITAGARNPEAFVILLGIRTQKVKIGYSYDATVSQASSGAPNSHEVSLAFELKKRKYKKVVRPVRCPDF